MASWRGALLVWMLGLRCGGLARIGGTARRGEQEQQEEEQQEEEKKEEG